MSEPTPDITDEQKRRIWANILRRLDERDSRISGSRRVPSVIRLLLRCSPAAIVWLVITIRVNAVNRGAFRSVAHVTKEHGEGLPFVANPYSTLPVPVPSIIVGVFAALPHREPDLVFTVISARQSRILVDKRITMYKFSPVVLSAKIERHNERIAAVNPATLPSPIGVMKLRRWADGSMKSIAHIMHGAKALSVMGFAAALDRTNAGDTLHTCIIQEV